MLRFTLFPVAITLLGIPIAASADSLQEIQRLRELADKAQINPQELQEATKLLDNLRRQTSKGDQTVIAALFKIVEVGKAKILGPLTLPILCEKADAKNAEEIIQMITEQMKDLKTRPLTNKDRTNAGASALVNTFVDQGAPLLITTLDDVRPLFSVLIECTTCRPPVLRASVKQRAWWLIADADVVLEIRKEYALKLMEAMRRNHLCPDRFKRLFGKEDIPMLRRLIRAPNNTPSTFCMWAADILAHLGDEGSIPDVRAFILAHPIGPAPPEEQVKAYSFRIELQHPPAKLLDFISGGVWNGWSRVWAMERALDYKIDKARIRDAILEHAKEHVDDHPTFRFELYRLKQRAIKLGVLQENDLPNVKAPPSHNLTP